MLLVEETETTITIIGVGPYGVMNKVLDCAIIISEFEL